MRVYLLTMIIAAVGVFSAPVEVKRDAGKLFLCQGTHRAEISLHN